MRGLGAGRARGTRATTPRALAALTALLGCAPDLGPPPSTLTAPMVLAVIATPAEQRAGQPVNYRAIVGGPEGPVPTASLAWAYCTAPRPLTEAGPVAPDCLAEARTPLMGDDLEITATLPADACRRFGPDPPPGDFRAQDPDATGGYYQPLLVQGLDLDVVFGHRVRCGVARAAAELARAYDETYRDNTPPRIAQLTVQGEVARLELAADAYETYPVLAPGADALVSRTEVLRVSWWVSSGRLSEAAGRVDDGRAETLWLDAAPGATVWAIVRDDRGAADLATAVR